VLIPAWRRCRWASWLRRASAHCSFEALVRVPAHRDEVRYTWWTLTEDALRAETAPHRLRVLPHGPAGAGLYRVLPEG
jgi:hypothetical protein